MWTMCKCTCCCNYANIPIVGYQLYEMYIDWYFDKQVTSASEHVDHLSAGLYMNQSQKDSVNFWGPHQ